MAVANNYDQDNLRISWLYDPFDIWLDHLDIITPHLVIKLAKICVHNIQNGFAREPVCLLLCQTMTFAWDDPDAAMAKNQLTIKKNNARVQLDISRHQVALSSTQITELIKDMDSDFFQIDDLYETFIQVKDKADKFAAHI